MDLTIRLATDADARAVAVLAAVDSQEVPAGPLLLAEVGGELWAAESVTGGGSIADPFRPTADIRELLRERARQLAAADAGASRGWTFPRLRRRAIASG
ncbi:MAG TPA: hypothetical protein VFR97_03940 [Capillimicrobium sp.]|nr:hypothetical protein [Capillimicrobium sp.]